MDTQQGKNNQDELKAMLKNLMSEILQEQQDETKNGEKSQEKKPKKKKEATNTNGSNAVQPIRDWEKIQEIKSYLKQKNERDYALFVIGINVGLRISDLLKLKVGNFKGEYLEIKEQKTGKTRKYKINDSLRKFVNEYTKGMGEDNYLFPSRKKKNGKQQPLQRSQAYIIIHGAGEAVGVENVGTHTLRKTYGYHFYKKTKDVAMLQKIFNHSSPSETLKYIGIEQEQIDKIVDDFSIGI